MPFNLSGEQREQFFRNSLEIAGKYNPDIKKLLPRLKQLYLSVLTNQTECDDIYTCLLK